MVGIIIPWWVPKLAFLTYTKVALGFGLFLGKLGLDAPYIIHANFGPNAAIGSVAIPVDDYLKIVEVREAHTTAGSDGGAVTLTIEKLTGTQAPAGGANMFKTSTINLKTAVNTVSRLVASQLTGLSVAQTAAMQLSPGDRIGLTFGGTLTALVGVGVTIVLQRTRQGAPGSYAR